MPLHDWTEREGFEGLHTFWMTELIRAIRPELPPGYRAVIGTTPVGLVELESVKPDVSVRNGTGHPPRRPPATVPAPDVEVAVAVLEEDPTVQVVKSGRLVAAIELISPRNKDRPAARQKYAGRYAGYLHGGVHLLLVDVHRRPVGFSFAQAVSAELGEALPAAPAPSVVSYRVGPAAAFGGRLLDVWHRPLVVGEALPEMPLPLTYDDAVMVDLEGTYSRAAHDAYVE
ncbi:MAG: DUF4058 family protein [Gemmataceae bacterium]|nr:DUF4058 family protein [Gemmataceae bacterium]